MVEYIALFFFLLFTGAIVSTMNGMVSDAMYPERRLAKRSRKSVGAGERGGDGSASTGGTENTEDAAVETVEIARRIREEHVVRSFESMSKGARYFLTIHDPTTDTGLIGGLTKRYIEDNMDRDNYLKYNRRSPLIECAENDYNYSKRSLKRISARKNPLGQRRLLTMASLNDFNLADITDAEWEMIVQRYVWHVKDLHDKHIRALPALSRANELSKKELSRAVRSDEARREIGASTAASKRNDDDPKEAWEFDFAELSADYPGDASAGSKHSASGPRRLLRSILSPKKTASAEGAEEGVD